MLQFERDGKKTGKRKKSVKKQICISILLLILLTSIVSAEATNDTIDAAGKVTVTDVDIEPSVLMTGDVGTIKFTVENTDNNSNVVISDAELISKEITVLNSDTYKVSRTIGAGTKTDFTFTILANQPENIYYPAFYINYRDAGSLRYNVPIRVEEPQLAVSVSGIPETFTEGVTSTIYLNLGNAKSVNITGITIVPSGNGIQINRTSAFVGDLWPHNEKGIGFQVTPTTSTNLNFDINYTCGMNSHHTSYSLPISTGNDKLAADPVLNNVELTSASSGLEISGDVSNAGIDDANGVMVSLESAAGENGNPNQKYVVGTITSGDYSSFTITVPQNLKTIPLVITYRDSSGNQLTKKVTINPEEINGKVSASQTGTEGMPSGGFPSGGGAPPSGGSSGGTAPSNGRSGGSGGGVNPMNPLSGMGNGMSSLPITEILIGVIVLIILIVGVVLWKRRSKGKKPNSSSK
jgi:hypothetical protein